MKDSGIQWIGQIPENWLKQKVIYCLSMPITDGPHTTPELLDEGIPFVSAEAVSCGKRGKIDFNHIRGYISEEFYKECCQKYIPQIDDVYMIKSGATTGKAAIVDTNIKFTIWSPLAVFRTNRNKLLPKLLYYMILSDYFQKQIEFAWTFGTQQNIGMRVIEQLYLAVPPLTEQTRIADFLDKKCSAIDSVLEKTKASIEEYKKLKQSVITQAVTKGIRPNRPMKDSGIEWIGQIPEDWSRQKVLHCLSMPITDGPHTTPELFDHGIPFVSAEAVSCGRNGKIDFSHIRGYISEEFYNECCLKYIPKINDVYMIKSGATTGRAAIVDTDIKFTIWSPLAVFRTDVNKLLPKMIYYIILADYFQKQVEFGWTFGTQQNIGMRTLEQLQLAIPLLSEQHEIVDYLDKTCAELDNLIAKKEQFLTEIEAYKKSLIYEYVTGKKEVL